MLPRRCHSNLTDSNAHHQLQFSLLLKLLYCYVTIHQPGIDGSASSLAICTYILTMMVDLSAILTCQLSPAVPQHLLGWAHHSAGLASF